MKRTKIVATLGPASSEPSVLEAMLRAGVNVFRVNFSHGSHEQHRGTIRTIREILERTGLHAAILADLQGPKLRVGVVEEGAVVEPGDRVVFTNEKCDGTKERVYMTYAQFPKDVNPGETILLDDGKLMMRVLSTNRQDEVVTEVVQGGPLKSKKGVNLPNTRVSLPCLTEKDLADLDVAMDENVDWIGLSFVRNAQDIKRVGSGLLIQTADNHELQLADLKVVTKVQPTAAQLQDLLFAWKVAKYVKSNAIVFCANGMTMGVGAGQMSRLDSARIASIKAGHASLSLQNTVVASDAFFPFRDGIDAAGERGIAAVIQPGGSIRDDEIIAAADEHGMAMVFTGMRHFRH